MLGSLTVFIPRKKGPWEQPIGNYKLFVHFSVLHHSQPALLFDLITERSLMRTYQPMVNTTASLVADTLSQKQL